MVKEFGKTKGNAYYYLYKAVTANFVGIFYEDWKATAEAAERRANEGNCKEVILHLNILSKKSWSNLRVNARKEEIKALLPGLEKTLTKKKIPAFPTKREDGDMVWKFECKNK